MRQQSVIIVKFSGIVVGNLVDVIATVCIITLSVIMSVIIYHAVPALLVHGMLKIHH